MRRVTLNRPEKRNALNNQLRTEILHALEEADRDPEVRDKAFGDYREREKKE